MGPAFQAGGRDSKGVDTEWFPPLWEPRFLYQRRLIRATPVCELVCAQCRRDLDRRERKGKACDIPRAISFRSAVPGARTLRTIGTAMPQMPSGAAHIVQLCSSAALQQSLTSLQLWHKETANLLQRMPARTRPPALTLASGKRPSGSFLAKAVADLFGQGPDSSPQIGEDRNQLAEERKRDSQKGGNHGCPSFWSAKRKGSARNTSRKAAPWFKRTPPAPPPRKVSGELRFPSNL